MYFYIFKLYVLHIIWLDTSFVSAYERRAEIHVFQIFGGHLHRHLGKYATVNIAFWIFELYVLHFIWIDISFVFVSESEQKYIKFKFSAAILAAILENMQLLLFISAYLNSTSFITYESTHYPCLYLNVELRYIRFIFSAAILAVILKNMQLLLFISTYLNSTSLNSYESTLYLSLYPKARTEIR